MTCFNNFNKDDLLKLIFNARVNCGIDSNGNTFNLEEGETKEKFNYILEQLKLNRHSYIEEIKKISSKSDQVIVLFFKQRVEIFYKNDFYRCCSNLHFYYNDNIVLSDELFYLYEKIKNKNLKGIAII